VVTLPYKDKTHLDETISRIAIPQVCYGEELTPWYSLFNLGGVYLHDKEGNRTLLCTIRIGFILLWIEFGIVDFVKPRLVGELVKNVT